KSPNVLHVVGKGSGDISEAVSILPNDAVCYGFAKIAFTANDNSERTKFVFFTWEGPEIGAMQRSKISVHKGAVKSVFRDFSLEIQTDTRNDLAEEALVKRIKHVNY